MDEACQRHVIRPNRGTRVRSPLIVKIARVSKVCYDFFVQNVMLSLQRRIVTVQRSVMKLVRRATGKFHY